MLIKNISIVISYFRNVLLSVRSDINHLLESGSRIHSMLAFKGFAKMTVVLILRSKRDSKGQPLEKITLIDSSLLTEISHCKALFR